MKSSNNKYSLKCIKFRKRIFLYFIITGIAILTLIYSTILKFFFLPPPQGYYPWAVYYSDKAPLEAFAPYKLLVLDSDYHPPLQPLAEQGKILLGYISLGEVEKHRSWYEQAVENNFLLEENPNWPDSFYVDMREKIWHRMVIEQIIPEILAKGFHGIFYDTLDNPTALEQRDAIKYAGMRDASLRLLSEIRHRYPDIKIMMNRGYDLLPEAAQYIDMLLAESLFTDYDFVKKQYRVREIEEHQWALEKIAIAKNKNPTIGLYSLDYTEPEDISTIRKIYYLSRKNKLSPYFSTIDLQKLYSLP